MEIPPPPLGHSNKQATVKFIKESSEQEAGERYIWTAFSHLKRDREKQAITYP